MKCASCCGLELVLERGVLDATCYMLHATCYMLSPVLTAWDRTEASGAKLSPVLTAWDRTDTGLLHGAV